MRISIRLGGNKKQRFSVLIFSPYAKKQCQRVHEPMNNKKGLDNIHVGVRKGVSG